MKPSRWWSAVLVSGAIALAGCSGKQKAVDTPPPPPPPEAPVTATCGNWVVVTEIPVVSAGGYAADGLQRALMDGLAGGGCTAHTSTPASIPDGAKVLKIALKASAIGEAGKISAIATDASSGELVWRFQKSAAAGTDGSAEASAIGAEIAAKTAGG